MIRGGVVRTLWTALANSGMSVDSAMKIKEERIGQSAVRPGWKNRVSSEHWNQMHTTHWSDSFPPVLSVQVLKYCLINRNTIL
jgi:hypothetical protein